MKNNKKNKNHMKKLLYIVLGVIFLAPYGVGAAKVTYHFELVKKKPTWYDVRSDCKKIGTGWDLATVATPKSKWEYVKKTYAKSGAFVMDSYPSSGKNLGVLKGKICDFELGDWYDKCQRWKKLAISKDGKIGTCLGDLPGREKDIPKINGQWCRSKPYAPNLPGLCYGPKCTYVKSYKTWSTCESKPVGVQVGSGPVYDTVYGDKCVDASNRRTCGLCGTAAKNYSASDSQFSGTMCRSGTLKPANPVFPSAGSTTTWQCVGSDGGASATCTATRDEVISASCTGTVPRGAYICGGDQAGLTKNTPWQRVSSCTTARKCEYVMPSYSCIGTVPEGATMCDGDSTGLTRNTSWFKVAECTTGRKCEYTLPSAECGVAARSYPSSQEAYFPEEPFCGSECIIDGDEPTFPEPGGTVTWECKKGDSTKKCSASRSDVNRTTIKTEEESAADGRIIEERP